MATLAGPRPVTKAVDGKIYLAGDDGRREIFLAMFRATRPPWLTPRPEIADDPPPESAPLLDGGPLPLGGEGGGPVGSAK